MSKLKPANRFQEAFGLPVPGARAKVHDQMEEHVMDFIRSSPCWPPATDGATATRRSGQSPLSKLWQRRRQQPRRAAFLFPGSDHTVRVNERARPIDQTEVETLQTELPVYWYDDNTRLVQGLLIEVDEAYGHCPRAVKFSNLWDIEIIEKNRATR